MDRDFRVAFTRLVQKYPISHLAYGALTCKPPFYRFLKFLKQCLKLQAYQG